MNFIRKTNLSLSRFTTIKIGGIADVVFFPFDEKGIMEVFEEIRNEKKDFFILGGGSNVVINDSKLPYAVVMVSHLTHHKFHGNELDAEAGLSSSILSELAANNDFGGLEFFYGLPGSVGGAVYMNARAYESEIAELVKEVTVYDIAKNSFLTIPKEECGFEYKKSIFQDNPNYLIFKVRLILRPGMKKAELWKTMNKYKHDRKEKGHYTEPSAGCAFKNNREIGIPTGKLLDEIGMKGYQLGGIKVSEKHANFFVNASGGTFKDYQNLIREIKEKVKLEKNIDLETEVRFLPSGLI
ncbi:MAG TPA: UDP-N-acetylenolpyruvoylglucosamine reductase [Spirochaetia bacterium]|nr:MAG: UDP-N-acetylenolpyruvoylglucosamine reductase [Spirochaetes bacterium GWB1_36_13]HCL57799.1 UDP-N-acetylenolpyruvoylglucosamine reductase [Spirochaetia bacterium]